MSRLERVTKRIHHFGFQRYCVCCGSHLRRFGPFPPPKTGRPVRPEARCPICGSMERHRLLTQYLLQRTDLKNGRPKRLLHFAPEPYMASLFTSIPGVTYVSTDLSTARDVMVKADITKLSFPDASFDVIFCSHVLEHIPDERQAMAELRRVLRPDGWAIIQVPIMRQDATYEDPTITTKEGRLAAFGQTDHVRAYGPDFSDRLRRVGWRVTVERFGADLSEAARRRFGVRLMDVNVCRP